MRPASSLVALVVRRIVFFAALAMVVQFLGVFAEYWSDDENLGRLAVEMETEALSHGVSIQSQKLAFELPADLHERYANANRGYYARIRTASGAILFSNCDKDCAAHLIADPRARKVEQDLEDLNRLVEQLTTLARLEGASLDSMEAISPDRMAEQVVGALAPLVYAAGKEIEFVDRGSSSFRGHPALVENALRNLVENAIRHTGAGAKIHVEAGPGPAFSVCDDDHYAVESEKNPWPDALTGSASG